MPGGGGTPNRDRPAGERRLPAPGATRRRPRALPATDDKRERLKQLLRQKLLEPRIAPVSFAQERLWLLDRLSPGSTVYSETGAIRVEGPLDPALCVDALNALVRRHEALRTTFAMVEGRPVQRVAPVLTLDVPVMDRRDTDPGDRDQVVRDLAAEQSRVPFDLARGPLLRARLVRFGEADHGLIITLHHIIADGWSIGILLWELQTLARSPSTALADLPLQYADFARWQREHLNGRRLASHLNYWREHLRALPVLALPSDRTRPPVFSGRGRRLPLRLPRGLVESLRELARGQGATLYMTLLAAFQCLLSRCTDQSDVVVGSPVAGRDRPETAAMVGFFVNMLVLRTDLANDPTFREAIGRVRNTCLGAQDHDEVPFARLVTELQPERGLNRAPLFQIAFVLQKDILDQLTVPEFRVRRLEVDGGTSKFDLTLFLWEGADGIEGYFEYATDLFDEATIERMVAQFRTVLEGVVADPDARLSELPVLPTGERRQILVEWNGSGLPLAPTGSIHGRFERQVERTPNLVAIVAEDETLTYRELNLRANQLARHLRDLGVGAETCVGMLLERNADVIVAMLAILKAGGAYVPLEPRQPSSRIDWLVHDAGVRAVLTRRALAESLPEDVRAVCLDEEAASISERSGENFGPEALTDQLAYVIYTSGSTGRPRGVQITHANLLRLFDATAPWYRFDARDVWSFFHSYAFDFSVWEIWGALLHGGRLVVVPYWSSRSPTEMLRLLERERVTVLNQTPSAFRQLALADEEAGGDALSGLRLVIFGGEALEYRSLRSWFDRRGDERPQLVNMYGITETTVHVTYRPVKSAHATNGTGSPIGRPIPDLAVYVLDRACELVPIGVVGELYVGGGGLARGYVGRGDWTAERFVPDGLSGAVGSRLYRTGDRVRWLGSGELEFVGRVDEQLKVRGHRIEPGEVESALELQPGVSRAVVVTRGEPGVEPRLVAYVVMRRGENGVAGGEVGADGLVDGADGLGDGAEVGGERFGGEVVVGRVGTRVGESGLESLSSGEWPGAGELRAGLLERLPEYMVPSLFVRLASLPLTSNGKVDRESLPAPVGVGMEPGARYEIPRTEVEQELARIWGEVLGVSRVGVRDNFFELGGDSILSIQVVSRASRSGIRIAPADVFRHQTIEELSRVVGRRGLLEAEQGLVVGGVGLTPIQRWYFGGGQQEWSHYNQSVLLEPGSGVEAGQLDRVMREVLEHHDVLRMRYERDARGEWKQRSVGEEGLSGTSVCVDLSGLPSSRREGELERCCGDQQRGLDVGSGPLMRVAWFELGEGRRRLLWVIHHLAVDGVSWRILLEDFASVLGQLGGGLERVELPGKTTSYREWSERLAAHAGSGLVVSELGYWRGVVQSPRVRMPKDHESGGNEVEFAERVELSLGAEETRRLLQEAPVAYRARVEELLLTAFAQELGSFTGSASVAVDLEGHGREEELVGGVDLSRTVGWFTTLYPVRLTLREGAGAGAALKGVKEELRSVPGRGLGYGLLRYLRGEPGLETPSEVSFNYLGRLDGVLPPGTSWSIARESMGAVQGRGTRAYALDWNGWVSGGCLRMSWTYGSAQYERATIEGLAGRYVSRLRELVAHCLSADSGGATPSDFPLSGLDQSGVDLVVGKDRGVTDVYRLSPLQSGMLFHSLYAPGSGVYVEQLSLAVRGGIDAERFRRSWEHAVSRHEVLRTGFVWEGLPEPQQVVRRAVSLAWEEHDWRGRTLAEQERDLAELLEQDRREGFDLSCAPLMRWKLIRESQDRDRFVWSHHHLLLDGWSVPLLLQEVMLVYEALGSGVALELEAPRPYREYIGWLSERPREESERYWRSALAGLRSPTSLGMLGSPGVSELEATQGERQAELGAEATGRLSTWSREHRLTLSTVLQGAWGLLLSRTSGELDVLHGTTVSGRTAELDGIERMLGLFINTVPVRVRVRDEQGVAEWLSGLQEEQLLQRAHEHSALVEIQGWSELPRGVSLFESLLVVENYPVDRALERRAGSLQIEEVRQAERTNYPLTVVALPGERLGFRVSYAENRIDGPAVERMLGQLCRLLAAMPQAQSVRDLTLLTAEERQLLLEEWNATERKYPEVRGVHELIEAQAACRGEALALVAGDEKRSYAELDREASQLAARLRSLGVGPEVAVAVCLERSIELVTCLFAVWKAGGAYVPLDPNYPQDRLAYMLQDSRATVVLTRRGLAARLGPHQATLLCLDDPETPQKLAPQHPTPTRTNHKDQLAYILYTSGSTGTPKGVAVAHSALANLVRWHQVEYRLTPADRASQVASQAFDASAWEIWPHLAVGAAVHIVDDETRSSPERLIAWLDQRSITRCFLPTPLAEAALREAWPETIALRALLTGGDRLHSRPKSSLPFSLINHYGPTENTVVATSAVVRPGEGPPPIGVPIGNVRVYVLDRACELVPIGVVGELYVGGGGLARGYVGRGDWTAERFVPDGLSGAVGSRLYRTGDRVRWLGSGELEFVGRVDEQLKVRGHRIEPGEVESALELQPGVSRAVVVTRGEPGVEPRLVAYVVMRRGENGVAGGEVGADGLVDGADGLGDGAEVGGERFGGEVVVGRVGTRVGESGLESLSSGEWPGAGELRAGLLERLPEYMVPSLFVRLASLPLTSNGKVDRESLPAPVGVGMEPGARYEIPRTEVEQELARIWGEVLGVSRVGVRDNFFELGGDSILSIQVVSRASRSGIRIAPADVFRHQTIEELSRVVGRRGLLEAEQGLVVGGVGLTPIQRWYFGGGQQEWSHYNQSVLLEPGSGVEAGQLDRVMREVLEHHDVLRMRYERDARGEWKQRSVGEEGLSGTSVCVDLSGLPSSRREGELERCCGDQQRGLDVGSGPLMRVAWFELGEGRRRLLWVIHHLAVDGVSWRILLEDFASVLGQLGGGLERVELPGKTTSYREWSERLAAHAGSGLVVSELGYWRGVVQSPRVRMPKDHESGGNEVEFAERVELSLGAEETRRLLQEAPVAYRARVEELLLTAFAQELGSFTGSASVAVDLEGHGREEELVGGVDLSRTVGWFTTLYPVRLTLREGAGAGAALKGVKEELRSVPGRGLGYGLLRYLRGEPGLETPSEVSFNYLGRLDGVLPPGTSWSIARESMGAVQGRGTRAYALDWNGWVSGGCLRMSWTYGSAQYERATIEGLAGRYVSRLRELVAHCLSADSGGATPSDFPLSGLDQSGVDLVVGKDRGVTDVYRLSPLQSGMLFHSLYAPGSGVYVEQLSLAVRGGIDAERFRRSWEHAVSRHEVLRTGFVWEGLPEPQQVVRRAVSLAWEEHDWRGRTLAEQERDLAELLEQDRREGFDLSCAPLMRWKLIRESQDRDRFVWSHHHLLLDGWSVPLLLQEVMLVYEALGSGVALELEAPRPYREYIGWLSERPREESERYWRSALAGLRSPTSLGMLGSPGVSELEATQGERQAELGAEATGRLSTWSREHRLTLSTVLQGAWGLLLSRTSGELDVLHGTTVSGRTAELDGIERMLGLFINTVPVRVRVRDEQGVAEWLSGLQEEQLLQRAHEHSALVEIQGWSELPRGVSLFESLLVVENYPVDRALERRAGSLQIEEVRQAERTNYPLTVVALPGERLGFRVSYAENRIDGPAVERMLGQLCRLLAAMPQAQSVRDLTLLTAEERQLLLEEWNATERKYPEVRGVHELIEAQAACRGEALALVAGDEKRSYAELDREASQLAARLRSLGVGPEVAVAVCLERSIELVTCLFAVWKAGGAYVPLDPNYPQDRLAYMLQDSRATVVLTRRGLAARLGPHQATLLCLDDPETPQELPPQHTTPTRTNHKDQLAYILYTSGSTGTPKGVAVAHSALANYLAWCGESYGIRAGDTVPVHSPLGFDLTVTSLLAPLVTGACALLLPEERGLEALDRLLHEGRDLRLIKITPSHLRGLAAWDRSDSLVGNARVSGRVGDIDGAPESGGRENGGRDLPRVGTIVIGGEVLRAEVLSGWREITGVRLINEYGPTEAVVGCCTYEVGRDDPSSGDVPIGVPIGNVRVYVLDRACELVPIGVVGELYVGGGGLARGYVGRGDWTAERFVPDGLSGAVGSRLYRTGDRVRWLGSGELEFVGRVDEQLKVRGHRIEPGEVESALELQPGVSRAVVVTRGEPGVEPRLVAYVVMRRGENGVAGGEVGADGLVDGADGLGDGAEVGGERFGGEVVVGRVGTRVGESGLESLSSGEWPGAGELRAGLLERLPEYMVPSLFVRLASLPLTSNGKVDRESLPAPVGVGMEPGARYEIPRTEVEQELARIWGEVLGVSRVGVRDNFFELGGDSILSIQVVSRASRSGIRIAPADVFRHQTIEELSRVVGRRGLLEAEQGLVVGGVGLTPIQRWYFGGGQQEWSHYNQSVLLEPGSGVEAGQLDRVMREVLEHHDVLRMRYERDARGEWKQRSVGEEGLSGTSVCVDLSGLPSSRREGELERCCGDQQRGLDVGSGPLMRVAWFELGEGRRRLLWVIHHLAVDGVSWRILLEDFASVLGQLGGGLERVELPGKTTSYREWSERLAAHAGSGLVVSELGYWRGVVQSPRVRMPKDHESGGNEVEFAERVELSLGAEETRRLLQEAPVAYRARVEELLLTAFAQELGSFTGSASVAVDLEGHGREEELVGGVDLSRTVGWFTTLYPVRLTLREGAGAGAALKGVKEELRSVPGRGLGYGLLRYLRGEPGLETPSEVSFNYLGRLDGVLPPGTSWSIARESMGAVQGRGTRAYALDWNGWVSGGCLRMSWTYGSAQYERATIEGLAGRYVSRLRELVAHCLSADSGGATPSDFPLSGLDQSGVDLVVGKDRGVTDVYRLSPLQSGMLFHSLYAPGSGVYVEQLSLAVRGGIDAERFRRSWEHAVSRHEVLRTGFVWEGLPEPQQVVRRAVSLAWEEHDWRGRTLAEQERDLAELLEQDRREGFDLSCAPLMRWKLIRESQDRDRFVWSHHHLLLDGWSVPLLLQEVMLVYEALGSGVALELEAPRPYREYIGWLSERPREESERYWRSALAGLRSPTSLGMLGSPGVSELEATQGERQAELGAEATGRLSTWSREHRLTLSTVLQGAWGLLLSRTSGELDVLHGTTVSGRTAELDGIERMLGLFINTVPVRVRVRDEQGVAEWLSGLQEEQLLQRAHEHSALVEIQGWSELPRGVSLFESLLVVENYPVDRALERRAGSLQIEEVRQAERTNYPLTVVALPGERLGFRVSYAENRIDGPAVERMLGQLCRLLAAMPQAQSVRDLTLLTAEERQLLLEEWNATERKYPEVRGVHELIEAQAACRGEALALVAGDEKRSYAELDREASQLAARLRSLGVGPEVAVAVCLERSIELVTCLFAVWKAGGAYVPLDPNYPQDRLAYMLQDSRATVVLTRRGLAARLGPHQATLLCLDDPETPQKLAPQHPTPTRTNHKDQLAYILYTSGSTGTPKGVAVAHSALANLISWQLESSTAPRGTTLQFASPSFDVSVQETLATLAAGGRLVWIDDDERRDPSALLKALDSAHVERLFLPFVALQQLAEAAAQNGMPRDLREVITAGEPLTVTPEIERLFAEGQARELCNQYGPTETHVATAFRLSGPSRDWPRLPPIGRPVANVRAYLLDHRLEPVPFGVTGELFLGGEAPARGYHGLPTETAARFLPDPFSRRPGARMYRTGDLGRRHVSGEIEFGGRSDDQIKIRGFRIEPGEIEARLALHPAVRECAVVVRESPAGDKRLVAYVVPRDQAPPPSEALSTHLGQALPDYMIPSAIVFLPALPLTPTGKVDRRSLPEPAPAVGGRPFVAPGNPLEERLVELWIEVLGLERVGVHDDFFHLGGHSLLATRLVSRIRRATEKEVPLRALFEHPTIAGLARWLESSEVRQASLVPLLPQARDVEPPLSFSQQRLWFLDRLAPGSSTYNMPAAARLDGPLDIVALGHGLDEVVARHEILRTSFPAVEGTAHQRVAPSLSGVLRSIDLSGLAPEARHVEWNRLLHVEPRLPFDLAAGPLLRARVVRLAPQEHVLLLTLHHIVCDGWSIGILVREIAACYQVRRQGRAAILAPLPVQYADFASWQRRTLQGPALEALLGYWKGQLAGLPVLELPTDHPRPVVRTGRGATFRFEISEDSSRAIAALAERQGASQFMVLLAAFQVLLARYSGQRDLAIGSPIAGRTRTEIEGLVGFFVNTLVLRADLSGDPTFLELLARVRETAIEAYARQDLPFERLVEALRPTRDLGRDPLFQVMFAMAEGLPGAIDLDESLRLTPLPIDGGTSKFDLTLFVWSEPGRLGALFEYSTDLFDAETIAAMARHLEVLLAAATAAPTSSILDLALFDETEHLSIVQSAETERRVGPRTEAHVSFERQARMMPESVALSYDERRMTYGDLDSRANRLAHHLRGRGVGPESIVALCLEGFDQVVAVLAVLKAGGAFLSLDPAAPVERLAWMVRDARPALLLTDGMHAPLVSDLPVPCVLLDHEDPLLDTQPVTAPVLAVDPDRMAYVIYTSGSTGRPKGAMLTHAGLANLAEEQSRMLGLGPGSRVLQVAPWIYDASVWETVMALTSGATLVIAAAHERFPGSGLLELLRKHEVNVLTLPPSLLAALPDAELPCLRTLVLAGERCPLALARRWGRGRRLINAYGPTESTVCATWHEIALDDPAEPPIGRPLANLSAQILDERWNGVPVGVPGELCLGGVALARGYLNAPDRTAERFVPDPFGPPGARLYRTGDRCRRRRGGTIEFLGRDDDQIKIHGVRIEPGEIEARLHAIPGVREAIVVVREDAQGDPRLEAYFVANEPSVSAETLRGHLAAVLPPVMVPSRFVKLPELPRSLTGKLDRASLTAADRPGDAPLPVEPRTELERQLCEIWCEVLGVERVGVQHNFFEIGGHSLAAARLAARVQERLGRPLPLAAFFRAPTIAELASALEDLRPEPLSSLVTFRQEGSRRPFFCVHGGTGLVLDYLPIARRLSGDRPFYGLQAAGLFGEREPFTTIEEMAAHQLEVVRAVQPRGPYLLGGHSFGGLVAFEMALQLRRQGDRVERLVLLDSRGPGWNGNGANGVEELDLFEVARAIARFSGTEAATLEEELRTVPVPERIPWLGRWWSERQPGLPDPRSVLRVMRANAASSAAYRPGPCPDRIHLVRASVPGQEDTAADPCLGWSRFSASPVEVRVVPGDHFTMLAEPNAQLLAEHLESWFEQDN